MTTDNDYRSLLIPCGKYSGNQMRAPRAGEPNAAEYDRRFINWTRDCVAAGAVTIVPNGDRQIVADYWSALA